MSKIEEPLEKGWLGHVMRDVKNEVASWPSDSSFPKADRNESDSADALKCRSAAQALEMK
ncbi:MAG TPA: hypothetical protein VGM27_29850 [Acidobacteriaceae bacterium]|jgi:hypothetical protein